MMRFPSTAEVGRVDRAVIRSLALLCLLLVSSCGGGGGGGGNGFVAGSTTPFNAPLDTMNEAVTFNAIRSELKVICTTCNPESTATQRSSNYQIKVDPSTDTVEIFEFGNPKTVFHSIDFTNGTTTFDSSVNFISSATRESLWILLPGSAASNLDYTSYGVWSRRTDWTFPVTFTVFDGEALSFGVLTTAGGMPTTGNASYNGFMDGYYANGANETWSLTGSTNLTADFVTSQITGQVNNISATHITGPLGTSNFGDIAINGAISGDAFSGSASSSGLSGVIPGSTALTGSTLGQFYGPSADEVGGVFRMSSGTGGEAIGAFAAGQ